jgi:predicted nuclease of restriction endonuclease-like (RecB) superfamily
MSKALTRYATLLGEIKDRVRRAQTKAVFSANRLMLELYWDVGRMIHTRQQAESWGTGIIPRLAADMKNELPEVKGFSETNIKRMTQFYRAYPGLDLIGARPVPQLSVSPLRGDNRGVTSTADEEEGARPVPRLTDLETLQATLCELCLQLPWGQNIVLLQKVKDLPTRLWYMEQILAQGWGRDGLTLMIKSQAHSRQGAAVTNFEQQLPAPQSDLARQTLKDPYIFDFLTLTQPFRERELETGLVQHLEKFLMELGVGFAFIGRQHKLTVGEDDFYLDLLFYHLKLRCYMVVELKIGPFKPDYAGKMNFYLNLVDDTLRHEQDNATIGLILCQDKKQVLAEYALRGVDKPIGVSEYELTRALPESLVSALPTIEEIEAELMDNTDEETL